MLCQIILLYIDPGTGAMLFSVLMGVITALLFILQKVWLRIRFIISAGKVKETSEEKYTYVIFSDSKRYWNVFQPICDEFEKRQIECHYWTASPDDPALMMPYKYVKCLFIGEGNKAYAKLNMMHAEICLSSTPGLDVYQWKRSKNTDVYVHILHEVGGAAEYRMFGLDYYDAVLLSGDFQKEDIRQLEAVRNIKEKDLYVVGSTYMDSMKRRLNEVKQKTEKITTILVAPSWGESSILNKYGKKFLSAIVETGYKVIIRPHPQTAIANSGLLEELQALYPETELLKWNFDNDNFSVLNEADLLISDFSGIIFDFALLFDKPVMYANTHVDLSPYDACWLDKPIWRYQVLPEIGMQLEEKDFSQIKTVIAEMIASKEYSGKRMAIKSIAWQYEGEAAFRTVDYLVRRHNELTSRKEEARNA